MIRRADACLPDTVTRLKIIGAAAGYSPVLQTGPEEPPHPALVRAPRPCRLRLAGESPGRASWRLFPPRNSLQAVPCRLCLVGCALQGCAHFIRAVGRALRAQERDSAGLS